LPNLEGPTSSRRHDLVNTPLHQACRGARRVSIASLFSRLQFPHSAHRHFRLLWEQTHLLAVISVAERTIVSDEQQVLTQICHLRAAANSRKQAFARMYTQRLKMTQSGHGLLRPYERTTGARYWIILNLS
jgi:hypothetical protein